MAQKPSSKKPAEAPPKAGASPPGGDEPGILFIIREWADALVIAFILAMFVRVFVVELFKIPTGSMTPTLLGDFVYEHDFDEDGVDDLLVRGTKNLLFLKRDDHYEPDDRKVREMESSGLISKWTREGRFEARYDRILVNKFAYWFRNPDRGDVVVFKVPRSPDGSWDPNKQIYIKRCTGLPGDKLAFEGRLVANGREVDEPRFFQHQEYINLIPQGYASRLPDWVGFENTRDGNARITGVTVPQDGLYVMGDNTRSSYDSRYWGAVPLPNLKGKAFIRYWPLSKIARIQ